MKTEKHTQEWHLANGVFGPSICGPIQAGLTGGTTAPCIAKLTGEQWEEHGKIIIEAVNSHAALTAALDQAVEALEAAAFAFQDAQAWLPNGAYSDTIFAIAAALEAAKKARE